MKRILLMTMIVVLLTGCSRYYYPSINGFSDSSEFTKYRKIVILPFIDSPNAPNSGQLIQGLASKVFSQFGFKVAERSRLMEVLSEQRLILSGLSTNEQIQIGKLVGARAIVAGEVSQYETRLIRGIQPTYNPQSRRPTTAAEAFADGFTRSIERGQARDRYENHVSISLRIIDVETGSIIYSCSSEYETGWNKPLQFMSERILQCIVANWINPQYVSTSKAARRQMSANKFKIFDDFVPTVSTNLFVANADDVSIQQEKTHHVKNTDDLDDENRKLDVEQRRLDEERASFDKKKALAEKRQKIAEGRKRLAADQEAEQLAAVVGGGAKKSVNLATEVRQPAAVSNKIGRDGRFVSYDNGTVLDTKTNLMWAAKDNGENKDWRAAKSYCKYYRGGGYTDWRMPTQDELAGLYESGNYKNEIAITGSWVWASETRGFDAAYFYFTLGKRSWYPQSYDISTRALPVRSTK